MRELCNYILVTSLLLVGVPAVPRAQTFADTRLRLNAGVSYEPVKKLELTGRYRLTTHQGGTEFLRSMFSLRASYKIARGWEAGAEYRYNTSYQQDYHRYFVFTRVKYGIDKFDISYRLRYQQDQDYFDAEYLEAYPAERVLRNRLMVKYAYNKKCDVYTYADHFSELEDGGLSPFRVRYGAGVQYLYKKRHDISLEFFINDGFKRKRPQNVAAIDVSYTYLLSKKSKKKKKKN